MLSFQSNTTYIFFHSKIQITNLSSSIVQYKQQTIRDDTSIRVHLLCVCFFWGGGYTVTINITITL